LTVKQRVSVRTMVEFVLRHGDLQSGVTGSSRTVEGIKAHQLLQKKRGEDYQPEVTLQTTYVQEDYILEIHGRADGLFKKESRICIEEIKSTTIDLDEIDESFNTLHWAQAQCYAYILAEKDNLEIVEIQLTYVQLGTLETKSFKRMYEFEELRVFFLSLVQSYLEWARRLMAWSELRNTTIRNLEFPYLSYRPGQRELVIGSYKTFKEGKRLFVQAPTGIGKTFGTIFPAIKTLAEGFTPPIFYLTAKTITRTVAEKSLATLQEQGLAIKQLTLTAKDKVCFCPESSCKPEECEFARGYYDRVKAAVEDIFETHTWDREHIERFAKEYAICPFEFSLDLANWADFIICDYNYVFDPRVYLKRFFLEGGEYLFLIDEAHNLVDRAREMYSAELIKEEFLDLKRQVQKEEPSLTKRLQTVNNHLLKLKKQGLNVENEAPTSLYSSLEKFLKEADRILKQEELLPWKEQLTDLYFKVLGFLRIAEGYDEHYVTHYQDLDQRFSIKLFCVDPSKQLSEGLARGRAAILFSATLSPIEYYMQILGGESSSYKLKLESPFPSDNLCVLVHHRISTKYKHRAATITQVAECIASLVQSKIGNYIVYFPSYEYLREVHIKFCELCPGQQVITQTTGMTEEAREEFLNAFQANPESTLVGFALMGGIFGEGVDLTGNRLSGAVIVGVGLPQVAPEREIIRSHFETSHQLGYEFAYMYPGMNKVLQAVGRVIRTEKDRGVVLLIDERFSLGSYKRLFPKEWEHVQFIGDTQRLPSILERFWNQNP
jgi:DNA excision repair protein ERCC-2